jgi:hypothetical protein
MATARRFLKQDGITALVGAHRRVSGVRVGNRDGERAYVVVAITSTLERRCDERLKVPGPRGVFAGGPWRGDPNIALRVVGF